MINPRKDGAIFYGWWIATVGAVGMAIISAVTWQATGTFLVALEREFGWSRTVLSGAFSIARAEGALMGPIEGTLTDRIGARRTVVIGFLICALGFLLFTQVNRPLTFYVTFFIITSGAGLGGYIPLATVINNWFARRRATATSLLMIGGSIGGTMVPLIALGMVHYGWRWVAGGVGVIMLLATIPMMLVLRDHPRLMNLNPDGDVPRSEDNTEANQDAPRRNRIIRDLEMAPKQALRTWAFWAISISHSCTGIAMGTMGMHLVPHLTDQGLSLPIAGIIVLILTSVSASFQLVGGWLGDQFDKRMVIFIFMIVHGVSLIMLPTVDTFKIAVLFAIVAGLGHGGRAPAATSIRGDYFGRRYFGTILGLSTIPMNIGGIIIPLMAGFLFDVRGSYTISFITLSIMAFFGAFLILTMPSADRFRQIHGRTAN